MRYFALSDGPDTSIFAFCISRSGYCMRHLRLRFYAPPITKSIPSVVVTIFLFLQKMYSSSFYHAVNQEYVSVIHFCRIRYKCMNTDILHLYVYLVIFEFCIYIDDRDAYSTY